jgi:hypothetical protein
MVFQNVIPDLADPRIAVIDIVPILHDSLLVLFVRCEGLFDLLEMLVRCQLGLLLRELGDYSLKLNYGGIQVLDTCVALDYLSL